NIKEAALNFPNEDDKWKRRLYAGLQSAVEARLEGIFNDAIIFKAFSSGAKPKVKSLVDDLTKEGVSRETMRTTWTKFFDETLVPYAKSFGKNVLDNAGEEALQDFSHDMIQMFATGEGDFNEILANSFDTFVTTAMHSGLVAGMAAHGDVKGKAPFKAGLFQLANDPVNAIKEVNRQ